MTTRKKMIEVALPLEAINVASAREKNIRHGHPSTLHLWWARRPLAACRAVLFGSLVDDPSSWPEKFSTEEEQEVERQRLFRIIEELVKWENSNNETVLNAARAEIARSIAWNRGDQAPKGAKSVQDYLNKYAPPVLDPFCGGGSIPLEAQRLGLEAHGSDLNPVAVLITKALIEIPPVFAGCPPINPEAREGLAHSGGWKGARGLAEDVRYYGNWMREEAERRIGHLYPKMKLKGAGEATVIAWLWARTVRCPNPACGGMMPLVRSFWLSQKKAKEAWVEPLIDVQGKTVRFIAREGRPGATMKKTVDIGSGFLNDKGKKVKATFRCVVCDSGVIKGDYIDAEANSGRMRIMPLAIVAEGMQRRVYLSFDQKQWDAAIEEPTERVSDPDVAEKLPREPARGTFASNAQGRIYGFKTFADYFTARQLIALVTFSDVVSEVREKVRSDARAAGISDDGIALEKQGRKATAYADAVAIYLAFLVDQLVNHQSSLCGWNSTNAQMRNTFARQAISMAWDFAESNPFCNSSGSYANLFERLVKGFEALPASGVATTSQLDAVAVVNHSSRSIISTDPPYYNNIEYADLSDFFYVWLRRTVQRYYPNLFSTVLVPKKQELVATPYRFGGDAGAAKKFFEDGSVKAFSNMRQVQHPAFPLTVYYAFKQTEDDESTDRGSSISIASTGWETMLEGLVHAGFTVTGTWPMRTERTGRSVGIGTNALASSIVLVCRPRSEDASLATRREFLNALKRELPDALKKLQHGNIAPVDLAQAAIGPGMAVFSRYSKVVESDGSPMRVRAALQLINQALDEVLSEQESEYDAETRWAVAWFEQFGVTEAPYGVAEVLATAKATAVSSMVDAGLVSSGRGNVRLLRRDELPDDWNPATDERLTVWEVAQHLIRALDIGGDSAAASLFAKVGGLAEVARDLAYRLYTTSERKGWTQEALAYNSLVVAWPEIKRLAATPGTQTSGILF